MRWFLALILTAAPLLAQAPADLRREFPLADFSRASIGFDEILSGGPPRDGIPAITAPAVIPAAGETGLDPREPVLVMAQGGTARAWPLRYLMWHEIVNDTLDGVPIAVTWCPLCNTALVFDRRVGGQVLDFGVTGRLRFSDMLMYDRQTESFWQQATGEGVVGAFTGTILAPMAAWTDSWAGFRAEFPQGQVMAEPRASRSYGTNPYAGYDSLAQPFLYNGENPPHGIAPLARVVRVGNRAWPLERLRRLGRIQDAGLVLTWEGGMASPLDSRSIADGADTGRVRVRDAAGRDVVHDIPFAFAFHAFHPDGEWRLD